MKPIRRLVPAIFVAAAASLTSPSCAQPTRPVYAITNVTVVPMDRERLIPGQTVVVSNGRIDSVAPSHRTRVPAGAIVIEGRGRYLMPGLAEMHAHVPPDPKQAQWTQDVLFLYVANGITFARSMLGAPHHLELRSKAERGEIRSPRIYTSGPSLSGNSVANPEAGRRIVAEQKAAGYDTMKIQGGLSRASYDAIVDAARSHRISFGGHVPEAVGFARALDARQATVDHLDGYIPLLLRDQDSAPAGQGLFGYNLTDSVDERKIPLLAQRTRQSGVWNVPTDSIIHHLALPEPSAAAMESRPEMRYVPRPMLEQWKRARADFQSNPTYDPARARRFVAIRAKLIKALHDNGAGLLLGSDAPQWFNVPGFSLHRELRYLVDAGLTPYQALATGTREIARFLGTPDAFGTVQVGRRADLILLDANPLADIGNAQRRAGVMLNGRWLSERDIRAGLARIADRYKK